jgi:hypothetical protein
MISSIIRAIAYQPQTRRLTVAFVNARTYVYDDVPPDVADQFQRALSKGSYFNACIRDRFPYREWLRRAA